MRHLFALSLVVVVACKGSAGDPGADGTDGTSCTVTDNGDGTITVSCDDGTTVTIGGASVTRVDDEPEGDNCEFGGTAVHTGIDDDRDGTLDDEEIDDTAYVCNGSGGTPPCTTLDGDIVVRSHVDLLLLSGLGCSSIDGALRFEDYTGTNLDGLESLTSIGGALDIKSGSLVDVGGLANLVTVGVLSLEDVSSLTSLAPLNLSSTDGAVQIENAPALVDGPTLSGFTHISIVAPALETLDLGTLPATLEHYELVSSMSTVDLPNVTTIEDWLLLAGDDLTTVNAPQLETAGLVSLIGPVTTLDMGALTTAGTFGVESTALSALPLGSLEQVNFLSITYNPSLTSLDGLAALDTTELFEVNLYGNTALTDVSALAGLTSLSSLRLGNLSSLSTFSSVQSVFELVFLDGITSVTQLTALTSVQHLYFFGTDIVNLDGLNNLTTLQTLQITCNPDVATLNGLDGLTHVDSLWIGSNPDLSASVRDNFAAEFTYDFYSIDADTCP